MGSHNYLTVNGQIRSEHRSGDSQNRDYILDAQGSVVAVYQGTSIKADAAYTAFGGDISASWRIDEYRFQWVVGWGYRKSEIDWVNTYVRARHYSAMDGAWSSVDPLWPSERAYLYVGNRVMGAVDPSGKFGYGNYCGPRSGGNTLNNIDACCKEHDFCLETPWDWCSPPRRCECDCGLAMCVAQNLISSCGRDWKCYCSSLAVFDYALTNCVTCTKPSPIP